MENCNWLVFIMCSLCGRMSPDYQLQKRENEQTSQLKEKNGSNTSNNVIDKLHYQKKKKKWWEWLKAKEEWAAEDEIVSITDLMDVNLRKFQELVGDRGAWHSAVHGITKSQTRFSDWTAATMFLHIWNETFFI